MSLRDMPVIEESGSIFLPSPQKGKHLIFPHFFPPYLTHFCSHHLRGSLGASRVSRMGMKAEGQSREGSLKAKAFMEIRTLALETRKW